MVRLLQLRVVINYMVVVRLLYPFCIILYCIESLSRLYLCALCGA